MVIESAKDQQLTPQMDRALVRAVVAWAKRLGEGDIGSVRQLAKAGGYCSHYAMQMLPLAWLAPDFAELILQGRQPRGLSLSALMQHDIPVDWAEQRRLLATIR